MGLGDVSETHLLLKLSLLARPANGGAVMTRTFIPVRCHTAIGVLARPASPPGCASTAASARTSPVFPTTADGCASSIPPDSSTSRARSTTAPLGPPRGPPRTAVVRTARKIFDGTVFPGRPSRAPPLRRPAWPRPLGDIAHLGHVELLTPDLDGSLRFFTDYLGLTVNGRSGDSVYLRTWDDYEHHSLVLTAHQTSGLRRTALRASSEKALQRRVEELEAAGHQGRWTRTSRASARCTSPPTPTATNWPCTGSPSGTRPRTS